MVLIEPSAINLLSYSEDFSEWDIGDTQPLLNQITSPDGSTNAVKLNALNTPNQGYVSNFIPVTVSTTYTFSVYAKKGEQKYLCLVGLNPFTESYFDLESGTALSNNATSSSIEDVGNGWFRLSATFDAQTSTKFAGIYLSQTGNSLVASSIPNGEGVYIWGAQLETGSVSTSYIPTAGGDAAARTRAADDLVISGSAFSNFFNGSEGTFYIEAIDRDVSGGSHAYIVGQGTSQFFLYKNNQIPALNNFDGVNHIDISGIVSNQLFRAAVSYKTGVSPAPSVKSLSLDGTTLEDRTYNGNFASTNILKIGSGYTNVFSGHFRRILFWPYHSDSL